MKNIFNNLCRLNWFIIAVMLFGGISVQTATAGSKAAPPPPSPTSNKQKKSAKLAKKMLQVASTDFIDVVVNPASSWTSSLTTALNGKGATMKKSFANFPFKVYRIKQADIDAIMSRTDVDYMTLDDTVKTLGHLTATTGTNNIRELMGSSNYLDGSGIGIVVVDSGVDPNHFDLKSKSGISRLLYSQDFTGENRTDDPYGHGTHVASIAAGNELLSQGVLRRNRFKR